MYTMADLKLKSFFYQIAKQSINIHKLNKIKNISWACIYCINNIVLFRLGNLIKMFFFLVGKLFMQAFLRYFKGILWFRNNELINRLNKPNNIGIQSKEKHLPNFWLSFYCVAKARIKTAISVNGELFCRYSRECEKLQFFIINIFHQKMLNVLKKVF